MNRRTLLKRLSAAGLVTATATGMATAGDSDDVTSASFCYGGCCSEGNCIEIIEETDCESCWCEDC